LAAPRNKGRIIVSGILFWYPMAGVTYQFLHYMIGLRALGYDPFYVEDSGRWIYDPDSNNLSPDATRNIEAVVPALETHGFADKWAFRGAYAGGRCYGMSATRIAELYREADALLNVTGAQEIRDEHRVIPRRIYVETDPGASQIRVAEGDAAMIEMLSAHDTHFSFGENLGASDCKVPVAQFHWLPTRQPVVLELWANEAAPGTAYSTIGNWHTEGKDITYEGETYYWSKDREFMKLIDLPQRSSARFELATQVNDDARALLLRNGWLPVDADGIGRDIYDYRRYIQESRGEFTVAKDQNVRLRTGWFSDRSACYLAAGRPVINQDTAFGQALPTGKGLFAFRDADDVLNAIETIESDYEGNCRAAREIAAEYFAAEKVLGSLLERARL
jgi:hypothetical protein